MAFQLMSVIPELHAKYLHEPRRFLDQVNLLLGIPSSCAYLFLPCRRLLNKGITPHMRLGVTFSPAF